MLEQDPVPGGDGRDRRAEELPKRKVPRHDGQDQFPTFGQMKGP